VRLNEQIQKLKEFYFRNERHLSGAAMVTGFIIDNLTLTRIDLWIDNLILFTYLIVAGLGITIVNLSRGRLVHHPRMQQFSYIAPIVTQFAFGGLFSGFVVFYSRSSSLLGSWLFLLLLAGLLIGNEFFQKRYTQLVFQSSIFFIGVFSFAIFYVPIVVQSLDWWVFLASGLVSLVIIGGFLFLLSFVMPGAVHASRKYLLMSIGSLYLLINVLYFTNLIPPVPLSLKDAGVYHSVVREGDDYRLTVEETHWYDLRSRFRPVFHRVGSESVVVFTSVFAPTDIETTIYHRWEHYDESARQWVESGTISFPIVGGRDGGYRGYTKKTSVPPGKWRVEVINARGQILGQVRFNVAAASTALELDVVYR
jgi:hypothetical protein